MSDQTRLYRYYKEICQFIELVCKTKMPYKHDDPLVLSFLPSTSLSKLVNQMRKRNERKRKTKRRKNKNMQLD